MSDLRSGERGITFGHAIVAWIVIAAAIGSGLAALLPASENAIAVGAVVGGVAGVGLGLYAEFGNSKFARLLAVPGIIVALVK